MTDDISLREAEAGDLASVAAIYAAHVRAGTATFELEPPDEREIARRREEVLTKGLPWLVADRQGSVCGYAYAAPFRAREAYRFCVEDSIYLREDARGRGIGRRLLEALVARCEAQGARQMVAVIGDSANAASIALHRACGFDHLGTMRSAGWKLGRWLDVVFMQRELGAGDRTAPPA